MKNQPGRIKSAILRWLGVHVCQDVDEKHRLMTALQLPKGETFISPAEIFAALDSA